MPHIEIPALALARIESRTERQPNGCLSQPRIYTSTVIDGERIPVEIPTRLPVGYIDGDHCPMPDREPLDFTDWNRAGQQYTRDRIYQNNAAQWLIETLEALADQSDFTPSATLRDLCETYRLKARGL